MRKREALPNPPAGHRTKALRANRVKSSSGSWNARWRRESGGGDTDQPEGDCLRVSAEKAEHEKLNDERGVKPLPVSRSRDGAESGNAWPGRVGDSFCILAPEIIPQPRDGNYAGAGASDMPGRSGRTDRKSVV